uniref:2-phosphoglycerate kinase n=1 Tax=Cajanus cajan TaxID=3821 RepID=A0A151TLP9_CAJCA|nr:2-phosphoglycerate kinase [Cajanus cajan]
MKKEKEKIVNVTSPVSGEDSDDKQSSSFPSVRFSSRNGSSKYDFVKVKVWLGDNADHYYVLSRFLLSRMLTVTKIPNHVAIKIALELKKLLIDNSLLDVSQSDLEANLFKLMERRGYGEEYINRYKMMTRFHHQRVPLVILVCGTACVGKSTIATLLAQRLNLPNVLQTDMVYELLRTSTDAPLASTPVWARDFSSSEELITEFCRECRVVRKGLAGDLKKAMKDGKPIIIEGIHLDPSIYLVDDENKSPSGVHSENKVINPASVTVDDSATIQEKNIHEGSSDENNGGSKILSSNEGVSTDQVDSVSNSMASMGLIESISEHKVCLVGASLRELETDKPAISKAKSGPKPIIVPIVLKMAEFDHKALLEEWITSRTFNDKCPDLDNEKLVANLKTIQDYLCSFTSQGLTVVNVSATTFPQTLDWLHGYLLQCIEQGIKENVTQVVAA